MGLGNDLRHSFRALASRPGTSILAMLALALGIGLTTTMFSIVQGAFLRGLPFEESDRIMYVGRANQSRPDRLGNSPIDDYLDWRKEQRSFEELAASSTTSVVVSGGMAPERYRAGRITANMLALLRVKPIVGTGFTDKDCQRGAAPVALISYTVWKNQFRHDPGVIEQTVRINGVPTRILGVLPGKFGLPAVQDLWLPLELAPNEKRGQGVWVDII